MLKLLIANFRQAGKKFYILDPDDEYKDLTIVLGGYYIDMMGSKPVFDKLKQKIDI